MRFLKHEFAVIYKEFFKKTFLSKFMRNLEVKIESKESLSTEVRIHPL